MLENIMSAPIFMQITTIAIQLIAVLFKIDHVSPNFSLQRDLLKELSPKINTRFSDTIFLCAEFNR